MRTLKGKHAVVPVSIFPPEVLYETGTYLGYSDKSHEHTFLLDNGLTIGVEKKNFHLVKFEK